MDSSRSIIITVGENPPPRLDKALVDFVPDNEVLSRTRANRLIRQGLVSRDGEAVCEPDFTVREGEQWKVEFPEVADSGISGEDIPLSIIFEDDSLVVINKPSNLVMHPARGHAGGTLVNALIHHCGDSLLGVGDERRPGIVHRLDKDTTGVLVAAKTDRAMHFLSEQFAMRTAKRRYKAVVRGTPGFDRATGFNGFPGVSFEEGGVVRIEGNIDRHPTDRLKWGVVGEGGRSAVTRTRSVHQLMSGEVSLVECWLETGRTHQIRVHLSHIGHPLVGDQLYGTGAKVLPDWIDAKTRASVAEFPRQALHAETLEFTHPISGKRMSFASSLPQDMQELLNSLGLPHSLEV